MLTKQSENLLPHQTTNKSMMHLCMGKEEEMDEDERKEDGKEQRSEGKKEQKKKEEEETERVTDKTCFHLKV